MKRAYVTLIIIIMLLSLLVACVNDTGIQPDTSLPQQSQPAPSPTRWPEAYSTIFEEYKTLADLIYHDDDYSFYDFMADSDDAYEWQTQNMHDLDSFLVSELVIDGLHYRERDDYGYALKDLNGDGSDELILISKGYTVFAVFSIVDGKPVLLDYYWDRYNCYAIDKSDLLYIFCYYDSSEDWYYTIQRLSDDGSEFLSIERYGMESHDYDTGERYPESRYYKMIDGKRYGERETISEAEFDELYNDFEKAAEAADNSGITFIPILD